MWLFIHGSRYFCKGNFHVQCLSLRFSKNLKFYSFFCVWVGRGICSCVCMHVCEYVHMCMQARGQFWVSFFRNAVHWDMVCHWPGACQDGHAAWPPSPRASLSLLPQHWDYSLSGSSVWVLGIYLSLMLTRKHFANYHCSPAILIISNNYFFVSLSLLL